LYLTYRLNLKNNTIVGLGCVKTEKISLTEQTEVTKSIDTFDNSAQVLLILFSVLSVRSVRNSYFYTTPISEF